MFVGREMVLAKAGGVKGDGGWLAVGEMVTSCFC